MKHRILLSAGLLFAMHAAAAAELEYALLGGATHSDNAERLPDGAERSASAAVVGFQARGERPAGRLRYDIAADVSFYEYLDRDVDSELLGRASLTGAYDFVPDILSWNASLAYDQVREDILRAFAPGNLDDQLGLSTGPTLRLRFSSVAEGLIEGRYSRLIQGGGDLDNETVGGSAMLARRANPRSLLALGVSYDDVSYLEGPGSGLFDFDRQEAFVRIGLEGARTDVIVEAGYAEVSGQAADDSDVMLRARLSRRVTPAVTGFLNAAREYPTSMAFPLSTDPTFSGGGAYDSSVLTQGPRLTTRVEGGLRLEQPRTGAEIAYARNKEDGRSSGAGVRHYDEVRGNFTRRFSPRAEGSVYGALTDEKFTGLAGSFDERLLGARLGIALGRALGVDLHVEHRKREGPIPTGEYSELAGGIFLRYAGEIGGGTQ